MKISWNDILPIERYLNDDLSQEDKILFEAQLVLDADLKLKVGVFKKIHTLIKLYGRKKMKREIEKIHNRLFHNPEHVVFQQRVLELFNDN